MKHESSIGKLYILTANSEPSRRLYFNVLLTDQMLERSEIYEDEFYYSSLYVPVSIAGNSQTNPSLISVETFQRKFWLLSVSLPLQAVIELFLLFSLFPSNRFVQSLLRSRFTLAFLDHCFTLWISILHSRFVIVSLLSINFPSICV